MHTASESISTALAARVARASRALGAWTVKSAMRDATSSGGETFLADIQQDLGRCHCERSEATSLRLRSHGGDCFGVLRTPRNDAIKPRRAAGPRAPWRRRAPFRRKLPPPEG